jgi:hypothetical protein
MGRPQGWGSEQTGRPIMQSSGRPGVNQRETKRAFWTCVAQGMESEAAARACGGYCHVAGMLPEMQRQLRV